MTPTITTEQSEAAAKFPAIASPEIEAPQASNEMRVAVTGLGQELKALAHRSSHYMAGLLANLALGFISFPIFTRVFSVDEYGIMDLGQRLLLLLTVVSKVGIQNASMRFYNGPEFAKDHSSERKYYSTMFYGVLATSAATVLLFLVAARLAPQALLAGPLTNLTYLLVALAVVRALSAILWGFLRIEERTKAFNILSFATKATTVAAVCSFLPWLGHTAHTFFAGTLAIEGALALGLTGWLLRRRLLALRFFKLDLFRSAMIYGAPLLVYEFAFAILGSADRFLVRHYVGAEALGFYAVAYGLARNVNELLVSPLTLALVPMYMRIWTSEGAAKTVSFLTVAFDVFIIASAGILAAVASSGRSIVVLLASSKYVGADRLIPVILAALLIYAAHVFVGAGLLIYKRTMQMGIILACCTAFNIGMNCVLLPRMGLMGGAISALLSYLTCIIALSLASRRYLPLAVPVTSLAKYTIAAALAWLAGSRFVFSSPAVEVLVRSTVAIAVYLIVLYMIDRRVRLAYDWCVTWLRSRNQLEPNH